MGLIRLAALGVGATFLVNKVTKSVEKHDQDKAERERSNSAYPPQSNSYGRNESGYFQDQRGAPPQYRDSRMGYANGQDGFRNGDSNGYASEK